MEICSPFTVRFPEVRKIEREYLKANWVCNTFSPLGKKKITALNVFFTVGKREEHQVVWQVDL